jgi:hypothetical protein
LEGAGWVAGGAVGLIVVPSRQVEMYPEFRARTAEAWRKRMHARKPIPLPARLPAIFAIAFACSFAADCLVCACEHGVSWDALLATRLIGSGYTLGSTAANGSVHAWERVRRLPIFQRAQLEGSIFWHGAETELVSVLRAGRGVVRLSLPSVEGKPFFRPGGTEMAFFRSSVPDRAELAHVVRHRRPGLPSWALHSC